MGNIKYKGVIQKQKNKRHIERTNRENLCRIISQLNKSCQSSKINIIYNQIAIKDQQIFIKRTEKAKKALQNKKVHKINHHKNIIEITLTQNNNNNKSSQQAHKMSERKLYLRIVPNKKRKATSRYQKLLIN